MGKNREKSATSIDVYECCIDVHEKYRKHCKKNGYDWHEWKYYKSFCKENKHDYRHYKEYCKKLKVDYHVYNKYW